MTEEHEPDIVLAWSLGRGNNTTSSRFHLACSVVAQFIEPTRDEVRTALMQILDEALGPEMVELNDDGYEIAGWADTPVGQSELEHLRAWKAEAMVLLETLDRCHDLLPPWAHAELGQSKAEAVERFLTGHPTE